ncbi:hypothetical protein SZN_00690 [Streptomyces zinciresistens K42]|uniref:Uncharacterized protein n=1 Tax=Streptomyces zinciresistens K42 TaxID=700597 RepID=G2G3T7_9ACTN|nr:hypothetical protein [Streptomyces zinciresistens]EGX61833.1 hypothetical protein SZN_00690 [Streptomyces zinciresistens K42]
MSRHPVSAVAARLRVNALGGDSALTALWVALHVPAALLLGHVLTDHATVAATAPPGSAAMADDTAPPE